jgi:hypothetical protein
MRKSHAVSNTGLPIRSWSISAWSMISASLFGRR